MRHGLAAAGAWLCGTIIALGQAVAAFGQQAPGPGNVAIRSYGSSYTGPGDIVSGASWWGGLRAYSNATANAHANAVILCTASDAACETQTLNSDGTLALGATGATCNNTTTVCTIKQFYDQSGGGVNLAQGTEGKRPVFRINCLGSLPCARFARASGQCMVTGVTPFQATTSMTFSYVLNITGSVTSQQGIIGIHSGIGANSVNDYHATSANTWWMYAGSAVRAITANDSTWHSEQSVYNNSTTPGAILDGTPITLAGSPGNATPNNPIHVGCDLTAGLAETDFMDGDWVEGGIWLSVAFNATQGGNMDANASTYWGF